MPGPNAVQYFLGANTAGGFHSLYDELTDGRIADYVWHIKGGPGNGKSTFMRRVADAAEKAGQTVEYVMCSGDPDSLDGIFIKETRVAYVDATSPHVSEPRLPGAAGRYLDLSAFYKKTAKYDEAAAARCFRDYRAQYAQAGSLLDAAVKCAPGNVPGLIDETVTGAVRSLAAEAAEHFPVREADAGVRRVFLGAFTWKGPLFFPALAESCGSLRLLRSRFGLEAVFLEALAAICRRRKLYTILCPDPLDPALPAGVLIPEVRVAYHRAFGGADIPGAETLDLDECIPKTRAADPTVREREGLYASLLRMAVKSLAAAKQTHDRLEQIYHPAVDFSALDRFTMEHISEYINSSI